MIETDIVGRCTVVVKGARCDATEVIEKIDGKALVALHFVDAEERSFDEGDARLHHLIANLPARLGLVLAYANGPVSGRELAHLLRCSLVFLGPDASLISGFGRPGSAAVYAAAAGKLGQVACERMFFGTGSVSASKAIAAGLASSARDLKEAVAEAEFRFATLAAVAKANLVSWPFSIEASIALIDAFPRSRAGTPSS